MTPALHGVLNHLWQSTLFAAAAGLLTLALRRNHAGARHALWLAASAKFLVPFSVLVSLGGRFGWRTASAEAPQITYLVQQIGAPLSTAPGRAVAVPVTASAPDAVPMVLAAVWLAGFLAVAISWFVRWRRVRAVVRAAAPLDPIPGLPIPARSSQTMVEPGVFGIFRPVLLLPDGILERLDAAQFRAVIAHELCHVERRDNLAAALHAVVEAAFWFHPLVWWMGRRMVEERERACDEQVLLRGAEPQAYAESILTVCEFYLAAPAVCVAGVSGADLKKRIERIMANRGVRRLDSAKKLMLAAAAFGALAGPVAIGVLNAPSGRAQTQTAAGDTVEFEVASVKPAAPMTGGRIMIGARGGPGSEDPGQITYNNLSLKDLIQDAYGVQSYQVTGPSWLDAARFDIAAKVPKGATREQSHAMLRNLLAERFALKLHHSTKDQQQVYELVVAKGGLKLKESVAKAGTAAGDVPPPPPPFPPPGAKTMATATGVAHGLPDPAPGQMMMMIRTAQGGSSMAMHLRARSQAIAGLVKALERQLDMPITDRTGLTGTYDIDLEFAPDVAQMRARMAAFGPPPPSHNAPDTAVPEPESLPSLFTALQEQLGLKLESAKGSVDLLVIDSIERVPTEN